MTRVDPHTIGVLNDVEPKIKFWIDKFANSNNTSDNSIPKSLLRPSKLRGTDVTSNCVSILVHRLRNKIDDRLCAEANDATYDSIYNVLFGSFLAGEK